MRFLLASVLAVLTVRCVAAGAASFRTESAVFEIDHRGFFSAIRRVDGDRNLLAAGQSAPVLQVRIGGRWFLPGQAVWDAARGRLALTFGADDARATVQATAKASHLVLELVEAQPMTAIELAVWGPYPISIGETIGEIVGVVRDRRDAVGIQALNPKTLGGYPQQENDADIEFGADDTGYYPGLPPELRKGQGFRGETARSAAFGSVLQAYCRNRNRERVIPNWGHERYRVRPYADGGVAGSRIALFASAESRALATIGAIEVAEGLPHPMIDGEWAKVARGATASYLIVDFGESTVDRAIEMTRRAGLRHLYHSSPFSKWGHFELKPGLFPNGWEGFRVCVEKARRAGVELGFHTLSNFITPSDSFVTPIPDAGLAVVGGSELTADVSATASELVVADAGFFARKSTLNTVRIGDELIRFASVATQAPWRLQGCERGAWGTRAAAHSRGVMVNRLLDHEYKVFLADASLSREMARRIADFCNHTGARQLSFDGLEGNWASGYGQYGRTLFTHAWYEALDDRARGRVINDASNPGHFNWHINTRMNWGEPWYAGFRESQTLYRFKNQVLFERNFMPRMLGWFALRPDTGIEDAEWLLARAAGFDAGFALATSLASTAQLEADPASAATDRQFGATTAILAAIARWEGARMAGAFPPDVKAMLRDNQREFHLSSADEGAWDLREAFVARFAHEAGPSAPTVFEYKGTPSPQTLQWIVRSTAKEAVRGFRLEIAGRPFVDRTDESIPPGGAVRYDGGAEVVVCDHAWREIGRWPIDPAMARVDADPVKVRVSSGPGVGTLKIELRTLGAAKRLRKAQPHAGTLESDRE